MGLMVEFSLVVAHPGDASACSAASVVAVALSATFAASLAVFVAASLATAALVLGVPWSVGGWFFLAFFLPGLGAVFLVLFL